MWAVLKSIAPPLEYDQSSDSTYSRYRCTLKYISLTSFAACRKGRGASPTGIQHDLRNEGIVRHHHGYSPEEGLEVVRQL
jgi:hypothetical protein